MSAIPRGTLFEAAFEAPGAPDEVVLRARFRGPGGFERVVEGFWDGGANWKLRFAPDAPGEWTWSAEAAPRVEALRAEGRFECVPYEGDNPVYRHGALKLAPDRLRLATADGRPFFWLADTAWNGVLRAEPADWTRYLETRRAQGFNVVQFVATHWRGLEADAHGERAYVNDAAPRINPAFFQRLDAKLAAINAHGLYAAPVILWALQPEDPGRKLPEAGALKLARYVVARYGAHQLAWFLGGDCPYVKDGVEKWKRLGRELFGAKHEKSDRLVTLHPCGLSWIGSEFADEGWLDFIGYQSGHGDRPEQLRWHVMGPAAQAGLESPRRPILNLEPNYEGHRASGGARRFGEYEVRRAAWWSCLLAPAAGVSYGCNEVWNWGARREQAAGHAELGEIEPWHTMLESPGLRAMRLLKKFFEAMPWWRLKPAPHLLFNQPGREDPAAFVAAAATPEGDAAVLYCPRGGKHLLRADNLKRPAAAMWFDPRKGKFQAGGACKSREFEVQAPDAQDWVCLLGKRG